MPKPKIGWLTRTFIATTTHHSVTVEPDPDHPYLYAVEVQNWSGDDRIDAYLADGFATVRAIGLIPQGDVTYTGTYNRESAVWSGKIPFVPGMILVAEFLNCTIGDELKIRALVANE